MTIVGTITTSTEIMAAIVVGIKNVLLFNQDITTSERIIHLRCTTPLHRLQ